MITTFFPSRPSATAPGTFVRMPDCPAVQMEDYFVRRISYLLTFNDALPAGLTTTDQGGLKPAELMPVRAVLAHILYSPSGLASAFWLTEFGLKNTKKAAILSEHVENFLALVNYCIDNGCYLRWGA